MKLIEMRMSILLATVFQSDVLSYKRSNILGSGLGAIAKHCGEHGKDG